MNTKALIDLFSFLQDNKNETLCWGRISSETNRVMDATRTKMRK